MIFIRYSKTVSKLKLASQSVHKTLPICTKIYTKTPHLYIKQIPLLIICKSNIPQIVFLARPIVYKDQRVEIMFKSVKITQTILQSNRQEKKVLHLRYCWNIIPARSKQSLFCKQ